jgi:hypothetical protein
MKMMDLLYNIKEIESTMEVGGSGPPRRQLIIVNLKLEYLRIVAGFFHVLNLTQAGSMRDYSLCS